MDTTLAAHLEIDPKVVAGIERAALDYGEGYFMARPDLVERGLHEGFMKRSAEPDGVAIHHLDKAYMVTRASERSPEDCELHLIIDSVDQNIASARLESCRYVDYLHLICTEGHWKLLNVLFTERV